MSLIPLPPSLYPSIPLSLPPSLPPSTCGCAQVNQEDFNKAKEKTLYRKRGNIPEGLYL
jgi:hypothetical protein